MYRADNKDQFPPNLEVLVNDAYTNRTDAFVDPSDPNPVTMGERGLRYSYEYPGPLPKDVPSSFIILCSRKGLSPGGRNVLYADGPPCSSSPRKSSTGTAAGPRLLAQAAVRLADREAQRRVHGSAEGRFPQVLRGGCGGADSCAVVIAEAG